LQGHAPYDLTDFLPLDPPLKGSTTSK
jgi:hypothetical protein